MAREDLARRAPLIDRRAYDAALGFIEARALELHKPQLVATLRAINIERPSVLDVKLFTTAVAQLAPFREFHQQYPFVVAPPGMLDGRPYQTPFRQAADGQRITYDDDEGTRHFLLAGPTGEGKSTAAAQLVAGARAGGAHAVVIDAKRELRGVAAHDEDFLFLDRPAGFNLLAPDDALSIPGLIDVNIDVGKQCLYGGAAYAAIAQAAYERAYARCPQAAMPDFVDEVDALANKGETYSYRDSQRNTSGKHRRALRSYPHLHMRGAPGIAALFGHSLYLPLAGTSDVDDFHATYVVRRLFHYAQAHPTPGVLRYLVLLDEGQPFFSDDPNTITGRASLSVIQGMSRSTGISFCVNTNALTLTDASLRGNVATIILFRPANGNDAREAQRMLGLTDAETTYAAAMPRGQVVVKLARWPKPILATFDPVAFRATDEEYKQAMQRTLAYLAMQRTALPTLDSAHSHLSEHNSSTSLPARDCGEWVQPTRKQAPPAPPPARVAPVVAESIAPNSKAPNIAPNSEEKSLPLGTREREFVTHVAEQGISTVIETYEALGLQPMQGDRLRKKLGPSGLGLLLDSRITVGAGRGKQATALMAAEVAYNMLGIKKPKLGRGSGPQHAWLLKQFERRIPHAVIEGMAGADITVVLNIEHQKFITVLRDTVGIALNTGDTVAIEVDLTTKTVKRNLERDKDFTLVLIATPKASTRRLTPNAIQIDVFALLEAL